MRPPQTGLAEGPHDAHHTTVAVPPACPTEEGNVYTGKASDSRCGDGVPAGAGEAGTGTRPHGAHSASSATTQPCSDVAAATRVLCQSPGPVPPVKYGSLQMLTSAIPEPNEDRSRGEEACYFSLSRAEASTAGAMPLIYSLLSDCLPCSSNKNIFTWMVIKLNLVY